MPSPDNYWKNRNEEMKQIRERMKSDAVYNKEIRNIYESATKNIEEVIERELNRFAGREGISIAEAQKRVRKMDVERYASKAKRYVKERNFTSEANRMLRVYNVTMRLNRLELMLQEIRLELISASDAEGKLLVTRLSDEAVKEITRQAGILGDAVLEGQALRDAVDSIVYADYKGVSFSSRLWTNQHELHNDLEITIRRSIIQGQNPRVTARQLTKHVNEKLLGKGESARFVSERLAITETARVQTCSQKFGYQHAGVDEFDLIEEPDACSLCKEVAAAGPYKVSEMEPGVNASPMHPFCRCGSAPRANRGEIEARLRARGL